MNAARGADSPKPPAPAQPAPAQAAPAQYLQQYPQHVSSRPQGPPRPQPIYPYETQRPVQPPQQHSPQQHAPRQPTTPPRKTATGRRLLGGLAFVVLTAISVPVHILAVFFVYVEFESPGDTLTAVLLVSGAFLASFAALFCTGLIAQLVGGFPGRWRARITFAALSGVIALGTAYLAALTLF